jgi:hypothetical protein
VAQQQGTLTQEIVQQQVVGTKHKKNNYFIMKRTILCFNKNFIRWKIDLILSIRDLQNLVFHCCTNQ